MQTCSQSEADGVAAEFLHNKGACLEGTKYEVTIYYTLLCDKVILGLSALG